MGCGVRSELTMVRSFHTLCLGMFAALLGVLTLGVAETSWAGDSEPEVVPPPRSSPATTHDKSRQRKQAKQNKKDNTKAEPDTESKGDSTTDKPKPPPIPDTWSAAEIAEGREQCRHMLANIDVIALPEASFRKGGCGAAAPIRLVAVGSSPQIVLSPPAIMTCRLARAVHTWATKDLQRLAKKHLQDDIIRIEVMSDYACRNTYGRKNGKLSEHALANALDIRGFSTAKGKVVRLLSSWGPTARDILAEKEKARRAEEARRKAEQEAAAIQAKLKERREGKDADPNQSTAKKIIKRGAEDVVLAGKQLATAAKKVLAKGLQAQTPALPLSKRITSQGHFLRAAHKAACKVFGTTLGPEANEAHRNHFHVDARPRRRSNFCE